MIPPQFRSYWSPQPRARVVGGKRYEPERNGNTWEVWWLRADRDYLRDPVDPATFVRAWQASRSIHEAAWRADCSHGQAYTIAAALRLRGVRLKRMTARRRHWPVDADVERLNALIRKPRKASRPATLWNDWRSP